MKSFVSVSNFTNDPSVSATHCQLLLSGPLCHFVTFPHSMGNHPFQGSHIFLYLFALADTFCYLLLQFCRDTACRVRRFMSRHIPLKTFHRKNHSVETNDCMRHDNLKIREVGHDLIRDIFACTIHILHIYPGQ